MLCFIAILWELLCAVYSVLTFISQSAYISVLGLVKKKRKEAT